MRRFVRARRALSVVAVAAVLGLTAACANPFTLKVPGSGSGPESGPVTDGVPDELLPFYDQQLAWEDCDEPMTNEAVECASVTAPLDWHQPGAGEIQLRISRPADVPAGAQSSLLINPGGPGGSGIDYLHSVIENDAIGERLLEAYSVVGFDPRGVARSTPVECLDAEGMDAYLYDTPDAERGTDEWEAELDERAKTFADACAENSGELLEFITTEQSARDMDLLRGVLGDDRLTYLGYSYGTFLGATYANIFPERVDRFVLDGALDPSVSGSDVGMTQVIAFEQSLRTYLETCLDGSSCPFRGTVDQALDDVSSLLASLDARPLVSSDGRELGGDTMMTAIVAAMYNEANWPYLSEAFSGARSGDPTAAMFLADFYNDRTPNGYGSNSTEAFNAYNCMDYPSESEEMSEEDEQLLEREAPVTWQYMLGADVCQFWPHPPTGERQAISADGADPIVVIGTTGDPATPFAWAEALADQLSSGTLITFEGEGHTAYGSGSSCVDDAVEDYFVDGTVPDDGLTCQPD